MTRNTLIAIAALGLVAAGCGGDDAADTTDTAETAVTQTTVTETTDATSATDTAPTAGTVIARADLEALANEAAAFGDRLAESAIADEAGLTELWSQVETSFESAVASLPEGRDEIDLGSEVFSDLMADLDDFQEAMTAHGANLEGDVVDSWRRFLTEMQTTVTG